MACAPGGSATPALQAVPPRRAGGALAPGAPAGGGAGCSPGCAASFGYARSRHGAPPCVAAATPAASAAHPVSSVAADLCVRRPSRRRPNGLAIKEGHPAVDEVRKGVVRSDGSFAAFTRRPGVREESGQELQMRPSCGRCCIAVSAGCATCTPPPAMSDERALGTASLPFAVLTIEILNICYTEKESSAVWGGVGCAGAMGVWGRRCE